MKAAKTKEYEFNKDFMIRDLPWKIHIVDPIDVDPQIDFNEGEDGSTLKSECTIFVNSKLSKECIYRAIKHEMRHAYIWTYGLEEVQWTEELMVSFGEVFGEEIDKLSSEIYKEYCESI